MKNYKKEDIEFAKFILENCETIIVPRDCFKYINMNYTQDGYEIDAHIVDNGNIDGYLFDTKSPLQRLSHHGDICSVELDLIDGNECEISTVWNDEDYQDNSFQESKLYSYKELKLSIDKYNKELRIRDVLKLPHGTVVLDECNNEYRVEEDDECRYLFDTYFTDKVLYGKFKIKR